MERDVAVKLLTAVQAMAPQFDEIAALTSEIADEAERKDIREKVAGAMSLLAFELVMQIVRQYPDLDPDEGRYGRLSPTDDP